MTSQQIQNTEFRKLKMADGRHFENSFIAISQPEIIRFQRNLVCRCRLCLQGRLLNKIPKFCKFKMADGRHWLLPQNGGRPPYWKSSFGYICRWTCLMSWRTNRLTDKSPWRPKFPTALPLCHGTVRPSGRFPSVRNSPLAPSSFYLLTHSLISHRTPDTVHVTVTVYGIKHLDWNGPNSKSDGLSGVINHATFHINDKSPGMVKTKAKITQSPNF